MFCVKCGASNPEGSKFCAKCGASISAGAASQADASAPAPTPAQSSMPLQPPAYAVPVESSGKALGSLICGILFFFFPAAVVAVVLGHLALSDINKAAGRLTGRGMAVAGLVLGYSGVLFIPFILIIAAIAIPNLLRARMAANEALAVESLRVINAANATYQNTYGNGFAPSLDALGGEAGSAASCDHALLLEEGLAAGEKRGYTFLYSPAPVQDGSHPALSPEAAKNGCTVPGSPAGYSVVADPLRRGTTGQRGFYTDATGVIRIDPNGTAAADSRPIN